MGEFLRNPKNGQWAGYIGDGKDQLPTGSSVPKERSGIPAGESEKSGKTSWNEIFGKFKELPLENPESASPWENPDLSTIENSEDQVYLQKCLDEGKDLSLIHTPECDLCDKPGTVGISTKDWEKGFSAYQQGELMQNCFPMLSAESREQLMSGYHSKCFDSVTA